MGVNFHIIPAPVFTDSSLGDIVAARVNLLCPNNLHDANASFRLPLDIVMLLISELLPKIQEIQASRHKAGTTNAALDFLGSVDLTHALPPAPPPIPRRFVVSHYSVLVEPRFLLRLSGLMHPLFGSPRYYGVKYTSEEWRRWASGTAPMFACFMSSTRTTSLGK